MHSQLNPMEVITIQSEAFQQIMATLKDIQSKVENMQSRKKALEDDLVDTFEACRILKICRRTLERYRDSGDLQYTKVKRRIFYRVSDIENLMLKNVIKPEPGIL